MAGSLLQSVPRAAEAHRQHCDLVFCDMNRQGLLQVRMDLVLGPSSLYCFPTIQCFFSIICWLFYSLGTSLSRSSSFSKITSLSPATPSLCFPHPHPVVPCFISIKTPQRGQVVERRRKWKGGAWRTLFILRCWPRASRYLSQHNTITIPLAIGPMLYLSFLWLICSTPGSLYLPTPLPPFCPTPQPWQPSVCTLCLVMGLFWAPYFLWGMFGRDGILVMKNMPPGFAMDLRGGGVPMACHYPTFRSCPSCLSLTTLSFHRAQGLQSWLQTMPNLTMPHCLWTPDISGAMKYSFAGQQTRCPEGNNFTRAPQYFWRLNSMCLFISPNRWFAQNSQKAAKLSQKHYRTLKVITQ